MLDSFVATSTCGDLPGGESPEFMGFAVRILLRDMEVKRHFHRPPRPFDILPSLPTSR